MSLVDRLAASVDALRRIPRADLRAAWSATVEDFRDPGSPVRCQLDPQLAERCALSSQGLAAGLEAVLGGVRDEHAARIFSEARDNASGEPILVVLAANLPGLAVQPLLPALAVRRPVLIKSPSAEPLFAPAFIQKLVEREPRLGGSIAAVTWKGGDRAIEAPVLARTGTIIAYGEQESLDDLARRAPGKVVAYGPKTSLAVVGREVDPAAVAKGLARDVALFDQRGCLSIAAVYTSGDARALAVALADSLAELAAVLPPGRAAPETVAAVQQARLEGEMRGLWLAPLPLLSGTVIVEAELSFRTTPGLRTVRIHPLVDLRQLPDFLSPWRGRLQGAALAGEEAWGLSAVLSELGVSRCAAPGDLQSPDASWHNGGISPLAVLGG